MPISRVSNCTLNKTIFLWGDTVISVEALQAIITADIRQLQADRAKHSTDKATESVELLSSLGRVLGRPVVSAIDIPPAAVSAMDGYGLCSNGKTLTVDTEWLCIGESVAGKPFNGQCRTGQCVRMMTGAVVPDGVDTVVIQENTRYVGNADSDRPVIALTRAQKQGANIRYQGEEVSQGETVLPQGHIISANDIPLLASLSYCRIAVYPKLRIGIFSTGDELCEPGSTLSTGKIYDSNRPTIKALLQSRPVITNDYGIVKDDLDSIKATLTQAARENDIIVTSGGVSVGDYDFLKGAVSELGEIVHYKVAIKPGKPFVYGRINQARYFGLPGNPLAVVISSMLFLIPAIYQYLTDAPAVLQFYGTLQNAIRRKTGRAELQRGFAHQNEGGEWLVRTDCSQDSHRVHQLSMANVLLFLPANVGELGIGDSVKLLPLSGRFI
ncbi:MAG: molybdopterin molybdenumtransferase MoeA [Gammaproteobacteria bacterium]|nr:MAG: molybdopterin molybdenumtransferase MoeA [Gammaproteobacteria bacterium]